MTTNPIPDWNAHGAIPPFDVRDPASANRSPYLTTLSDLVLRFGDNEKRRAILAGFIRYRDFLHNLGMVRGFQWLDGSFLEYVELLETRHPNDLDVVTFFHLPDGLSQRELLAKDTNGWLTDRAKTKTEVNIDGYLVCLDTRADRLVKESTYWYSMWSHRRNQTWKGYVQVDLAPSGDVDAKAILDAEGDAGGVS